jgi:hypothetical protein
MKNLNIGPYSVLQVSEDVYYDEIMEFEVFDGFKISFVYTDFVRNYFENLVELISISNFNQIIEESRFKYSENLKSYFGFFEKSLDYIIKENNTKKYLIILSSVDQRYKYDIFLEGVWELFDEDFKDS